MNIDESGNFITTLIINCHKNNLDITVPILFDSILKAENYSSYPILLVVGGYNSDELDSRYVIEPKTYSTLTYTKIKCTHNSIDFTALITLSELSNEALPKTPYYFYIHDTCTLGSTFFNSLDNALTKVLPCKALGVNKYFSKNLGLYSFAHIKDSTSLLLTMKNEKNDEESLHYFKTLGVKREDLLLKQFRSHFSVKSFCSKRTLIEITDFYKKGVPRQVLHYPELDLYKICANWESRKKYELNP